MKRSIVLAMLAVAGVAPARADTIEHTYLEIPIEGQRVRACAQHVGPLDAEHPRDVIVEWTGYSIEEGYSYQPAGGCSPQFGALIARMAPDGYVHIAANPPGMGRSTGSGLRLWANGRAGAQVIEWIDRQPWASGAIGIVGCSGSAMEGLPVVVEAPPALDAAAMGCFAVDAYRGAFYPGGVRHFTNFVNAARLFHDVDVEHGAPADDLSQGRLTTLNRTFNIVETTRLAYTTTTDDLYWQEKSTGSRLGDSGRAPMLALGSWHDFFSGAWEFAMLHRAPSDRVLISPGWHGSGFQTTGAFGWNERIHAWFDHHLRGSALPYASEPPIVYWELDGGFRPGVEAGAISDRFRASTAWPPPGVGWRRMFLGAGVLGDAPGGGPDALPYPAPAPGSTTDPRGFGVAGAFTAAIDDAGAATYVTEPLAEPMHVAGPITLTLWATSTGPDFDLVARLIDVAPDGSFSDITNGWLKASHRALDDARTLSAGGGQIIRPYHTHLDPEPVPPLQPIEYHIELWPTAAEVAAGHRLKLWISAQEPGWFTQDAGPSATLVLHDADHPSSLLVPVQETP